MCVCERVGYEIILAQVRVVSCRPLQSTVFAMPLDVVEWVAFLWSDQSSHQPATPGDVSTVLS